MRECFRGILTLLILALLPVARAQTNSDGALQERLKNLEEALNFTEQKLEKRVNDLLWFQRLGDIAEIDKVRYAGPPPRVTNNPTGQGAGNDIIVSAYNEDVNVLEVEHLITSLQAAGKSFEHRIYTNAPGGHAFNRLDTKLARESRQDIYRFLAKHLKPPNPVK